MAFAQAEGAPFPGTGSPRLGAPWGAGGMGWGEYYFEVRDHTPQFKRDLEYMRACVARFVGSAHVRMHARVHVWSGGGYGGGDVCACTCVVERPSCASCL